MPCFNVADSVARTVRSVRSQTYRDYELIAVDDGSSDKTLEVLRSEGRQMHSPSQLRIFSQSNQGAGAARNTGIRQSRGTFIAFLDADDLWTPDHLSDVARAFETFPQLAALCTNSWDLTADGRRLNVTRAGTGVFVIDDFFDVWRNNTIALRTSAVTVRRSAATAVGYMREDLLRAQDYEYWSRLAAGGLTWGFAPNPSVLYNAVRPQSLSRNRHRFANAPLPEVWSRDIWPLLTEPEMREDFRRYHIAWCVQWCWQELQSGLDEQARVTAGQACRRAVRCRERALLACLRYVPGEIHRLVWRLGSPTRRYLRSAARQLRARLP